MCATERVICQKIYSKHGHQIVVEPAAWRVNKLKRIVKILLSEPTEKSLSERNIYWVFKLAGWLKAGIDWGIRMVIQR